MGLPMKERQSLTREVAKRYQKARKKEKKRILDEFVKNTGYNRCYAAYVLRSHGRKVRVSKDKVLVGDAAKKTTRKRQKI